MAFKKTSTSKWLRALQVLTVFALSALIHGYSFANTGVATLKSARFAVWQNQDSCNQYFVKEAALFNSVVDPSLGVSIRVGNCFVTKDGTENNLNMPVELVGRHCRISRYTAYQLTALPRKVEASLLQALGIIDFGLNTEQNAYILAIPKCD